MINDGKQPTEEWDLADKEECKLQMCCCTYTKRNHQLSENMQCCVIFLC